MGLLIVSTPCFWAEITIPQSPSLESGMPQGKKRGYCAVTSKSD
jgi:hypothetical protein